MVYFFIVRKNMLNTDKRETIVALRNSKELAIIKTYLNAVYSVFHMNKHAYINIRILVFTVICI